jgi:hypothetical protein
MANKFGALTDHFGILALPSGGGTLNDVLELIESPLTPIAKSPASAEDENGDLAAEELIGNDDFDRKEASSKFLVKSDTNASSFLIGEISAGKVIESLTITTQPKSNPTIEVSGKIGLETIVAPTGYTNKFPLPSIAIKAIQAAQPLGFTVGADCKLTGSSITATCEHSEDTDGVGQPVVDGVSGATLEGRGEFVAIEADPSWTVTQTDAEEMQEPGAEEGQANWHTGTGVWRAILSRDSD